MYASGIKSPNYVTVPCSGCQAELKRRRGVVNPLCISCKEKKARDRRPKSYAHIQKGKRAVSSG